MLSILLWPLVVYHELIQRMYTRLEPLLMQLDYSMKAEADALHHKHDKRSKGIPWPRRGRRGGPWFETCEMPWDLDTLQTCGYVCPPPLFLLGHCPAVVL